MFGSNQKKQAKSSKNKKNSNKNQESELASHQTPKSKMKQTPVTMQPTRLDYDDHQVIGVEDISILS